MSKVSGTYPSLSRGVNQQPFEARLDGQHGEQVNMWSDPVHGLSRRRGTLAQGAVVDNIAGPSYFSLSVGDQKELRDYYASYRTMAWTTQGAQFLVHYPTRATPAWMASQLAGGTGGIKITRKVQDAGPLQPGAVIAEAAYSPAATSDYLLTWERIHKGFSAAVQVGRYLLLYPNSTPFFHAPSVDIWADRALNNPVAVEVKQGVPNRTYRLAATIDGNPYSWTYTTPSTAYTGVLDTSDIPYTATDYQKQVNDRVNAYNSAVTQWITTAASQTRPSYIIQQLVAAAAPLWGSVFEGWEVQDNAAVIFALRAHDWDIHDGGDGSLVAVAEQTVTDASKLTHIHYPGKIVQVKPERGTQSFYVKAVTVQQYTAFVSKVRWEECARTEQQQPPSPFVIIAYNPDSTTNTIGISVDNPALRVMIDDPTIDLPDFGVRLVGDEDSSPAPRYINQQVSWMGMFQDRLCLATGPHISMSEVGNYFNFYRTQTLTVPDSDPVEIFAIGAEADTIRHSVIFDRSLVLFGDLQQYHIDGRIPITPASAHVIQSGAVEDAVDCPPVTGGNSVFFGKRREETTEVFQMEVGDVAGTSNFVGLGLQLNDYLPGRPSQLLYVSSPSTLFVRTSEAPHSIFVFRFIDQGGQRLMDSWSRFEYNPAFGLIHSMFYHDDAVYLRVAREAWQDDTGKVWTGGRGDYGFDALERQSLLPQVSGMPYLDSVRRADSVYTGAAIGKDWWAENYPFLATVFARDKIANYSPTDPAPPKFQYWLHGVQPNIKTLSEWDAAFADIPTRDMDYCVAGIPFDSYVELTSPVRRDQGGQPIMQGRLTVNRLDVYYKDAGGFEATVTSRYGITQQYNSFDWSVTDTAYGKVTALRFNGRVLGQAANMVGVIPITTGSTTVFVGRESKDYVCKISSRGWMPLSITRVTWTGQWFLNHRFV